MMARWLPSVALAAVLALAAAEAGLRLVTPLPIYSGSNRVPDSLLVYRTDPALRDVDSSGYRNPEGHPRRIVAIGDSHTYGYNVSSEDSWPHELGAMLGEPVYNMGAGGYSLAQYYVTGVQALAAGAELLVLGLFPGNDQMGLCEPLALPAWREQSIFPALRTSACLDSVQEPEVPWPTRFSALWGLRPPKPMDADFMYTRGARSIGLEDDRIYRRTRWTSLTDSLAAQGLHNGRVLLRALVDQVESHGARIVALVIPSQDQVYATWAGAEGTHVLAQVSAESERAAIDAWTATLDSLGVPWASPLDRLVDLVERGVQVYPDHDDHPIEPGYRAYAEEARSLLVDLGEAL